MLTSQEGIWLVDVSTGAISKISSGRYSSLSISPDGRKLAVIGYANTSPPFSYEIVLFDIESALDKSSLQN
jgi:Tol biopolymer transport system component